MTTAQQHHHRSEAHFDTSPGEGTGHKPPGTPAREERSFVGAGVPTTPFEGGVEVASGKIVMSYNAVVKEAPSGKPDTVVYCAQPGVSISIRVHRKHFIDAIHWALKEPLFWTLVLEGKGLPVPRNRLKVLEELWFEKSAIPPQSVLKERKALPESLPCRGWSLSLLRAKIRHFWPRADPIYPKVKGKHLTPSEVSLLRKAVKTDVFYLVLNNPLIWVPLKKSQIGILATEFATPGKMLNGLSTHFRAEYPAGCAEEAVFACQDKENGDGKDLKTDVQDAEKGMTALKEVGSPQTQEKAGKVTAVSRIPVLEKQSAGRGKSALKEVGFSKVQNAEKGMAASKVVGFLQSLEESGKKAAVSRNFSKFKTRIPVLAKHGAEKRKTALKQAGSQQTQGKSGKETVVSRIPVLVKQDAEKGKAALKRIGFLQTQEKSGTKAATLRNVSKVKTRIPVLVKSELWSKQDSNRIASNSHPHTDTPPCEDGGTKLLEHKPKSRLALSFETFKNGFSLRKAGNAKKLEKSEGPNDKIGKSVYSEKDSDKMEKTTESTGLPAAKSLKEKCRWHGFEKLKSFVKKRSTVTEGKQEETTISKGSQINIEIDWFRRTARNDCKPNPENKLKTLHIPTVKEWKQKRAAKVKEKEMKGCIEAVKKFEADRAKEVRERERECSTTRQKCKDVTPQTDANGDKRKIVLKSWWDRQRKLQPEPNKACNILSPVRKQVEPDKNSHSSCTEKLSNVSGMDYKTLPRKTASDGIDTNTNPIIDGKPNVFCRLKNALCKVFTFRKRKQQEEPTDMKEIEDDSYDLDNRNFTIRRR